jgi:hypothetical protein
MLETLSILPMGFWAVVSLLIGGAVWAKTRLRDGSGLPMLAVLGTIAAWFAGDAFYNDYANYHAKVFKADILESAWWQVAWFLAVFLLATPLVHEWINGRHFQRGSGVLRILKFGINQPQLQRRLTVLFLGCFYLWLALDVIAAIRLKEQIIYYFFPFLGYNASPWGRGRIGGGFDALLSLAFYLQLLVAGGFGMVAAISTHRRTLQGALVCCLLSWPSFIFDRTRNTMLAVVVPAILGWVFLRLRGSVLKKVVALACCFIVVNGWMAFVIANRSTSSIVGALREEGFSIRSGEKVHHEGLNMYEELCWINTFIESGVYKPNWGSRYFAEVVNPIPRGLWPGKPLIGIDYAIVRGQGGGDQSGAGVFATISTGMIGQGVVNFGRVIGPAFAALLMSFWVAGLARLDLHIQELGRLPLYGLGLILTFNLGRDITFITLYPFVFGAVLIWWFDHRQHRGRGLITRASRQSAAYFPAAAVGEANARVAARRGSRSMRAGMRTKPALFSRQPGRFRLAGKRPGFENGLPGGKQF